MGSRHREVGGGGCGGCHGGDEGMMGSGGKKGGGEARGGIIPRTGAMLHSPGRRTLSLFNWIWGERLFIGELLALSCQKAP